MEIKPSLKNQPIFSLIRWFILEKDGRFNVIEGLTIEYFIETEGYHGGLLHFKLSTGLKQMRLLN